MTSLPSQDLPQAKLHQEAIVDVIVAIFCLPDKSFSALQKGGSRAVEKLLRSYHYWVEEYPVGKGFCPYDKPRCGYFRMTPKACDALETDELRCEHTVPVRVLQDLLRGLRDPQGRVSQADVERVMELNEIVAVTLEEADKLDSCGLKSKMPHDWNFDGKSSHLSRLKVGLQVDESDLKGLRKIGPPPSAAYHAFSRSTNGMRESVS